MNIYNLDDYRRVEGEVSREDAELVERRREQFRAVSEMLAYLEALND